jgi:hypothetical protein
VKLVMHYTEGDGCTYNATNDIPFEYESAEQAIEDFDALLETVKKTREPFTWLGVEYFSSHFDPKHYGEYPQFLTLDEWFDRFKQS